MLRIEGGATRRAHLQAVARATGKAPPELLIDPLPPALLYLWDTYLTLHGCKQERMSPITLADLHHWCALYDVALTPWELTTLLRTDHAVRTTLNTGATNEGRVTDH